MKEFIMTVDIGKKRDFFAIMVMQDSPEIVDGSRALQEPDRIVHHYDVVHISQARNLRYEQMVDAIMALEQHESLSNNHDLLVDGTGVGEAVIDMLRFKGAHPLPIVFTAGDQMREVREDMGKVFANIPGQLAALRTIKELRVPKADLVTAGAMLLQQGRVHMAEGLALGQDLEKQFVNFRGKVNEKTGRIKFEAEDEDIHDDLIVCYLMAAWWVLRGRKDDDVKERPLPRELKRDALTYNPMDFM